MRKYRAVNLIRQILFISLSLFALGAGCQTTDLPTVGPFQVPENMPLLIQISLDHLPLIANENSKFIVIRNNIQALILQNRPESATALLENAIVFVRNRFEGRERTEALIDLAESYIDAGSVSESLALLEQALERTYSTEDSQGDEILVQKIISVCFVIGDEAVNLLQRALRKIYAIKDYELRSILLLDIAQKYQEGGEGQRANTLLQQSIPAAISIADPLRQARAYSLLGLRFTVEESMRQSERYSTKTMELLEEALRSVNTEPGETVLTETLTNLAKTGFATEALTFSGAVSVLRLKVNLLLEIACSFYTQGQFSQADEMFDQISSILEDESPELVISMLLNISQVYFELDNRSSAESYLAATSDYLPDITDSSQADSSLLEIMFQYARIGNYEQAISTAESIADRRTRIRAYQEIVSMKLDNALTDEPLNEDILLLEEAVGIELGASILVGELFGEVAVLYARLGNVGGAFELAAQLTDPYQRALSIGRMAGFVNQDSENDALIALYEDRLRI